MVSPMPPLITNLHPGDHVFVAWIDSSNDCQVARVRVQEAYELEDGRFVVDVCDSDYRFQLIQSPPEPCVAVEMHDDSSERHVIDADADIAGRPVLGIEKSACRLQWQIQIRVLEMGGAPRDAVDMLALEFELYPASAYAAMRGVDEEELRARLDTAISGMVASAEAGNSSHN